MNHTIEINGHKFITAQVVDSYAGTTYDMTLIMEDPGDEHPLLLVGYYYGEPQEPVTRYYADQYLLKLD